RSKRDWSSDVCSSDLGLVLAALLAGNVGDVGVAHLLFRQCALEKIADHKACAVGIGEDDEPPLLGHLPEEGQKLPILHHAEALGGNDGRVDELGEGIAVVLALHHDGLLNLNHGAPPPAASEAAAPECAPDRRRCSSSASRPPYRASSPGGKTRRRGAWPPKRSWRGRRDGARGRWPF